MRAPLNGATALQRAADKGHKEIVEALLAGGAKCQLDKTTAAGQPYTMRR